MANEILKDDATRFILDTETDADSPDNETTYGDLRKVIEMLAIRAFSTGVSGTLTSDPPNDTTGKAEDTAAGFSDDEHNGRTLVFTSGTAKGKFYDIDDVVAADNAVYCTGDNLYSAGARSGDDYLILYDLTTNTDGHDHDDVNSAPVVLPTTTVQMCIISSKQASETTGTQYPSYATFGEFGIWIPANANKMRIQARLKNDNASHTTYAKVTIGGVDVTVQRTGSTNGWVEGSDVDVSALSGRYTASMALATSSTSYNAHISGLSVAFTV